MREAAENGALCHVFSRSMVSAEKLLAAKGGSPSAPSFTNQPVRLGPDILEAARNQGDGLFAAFAAGRYRYSVAGDTPSRSATLETVISGLASNVLATSRSSSLSFGGRPPVRPGKPRDEDTEGGNQPADKSLINGRLSLGSQLCAAKPSAPTATRPRGFSTASSPLTANIRD